MRVPVSIHAARPWRIHQIAHDFHVEDVWALPTPGGPEDFPLLVELLTSMDPSRSDSIIVRALFEIRWKLGALLGLDAPDGGIGARVASLRERLPEDLVARRGPQLEALPFEPLYLTDDEFAAEIANKTMHGIVHLGWVPDGKRGHRGEMAVLVRPNGLLGRAYMTGILPFRRMLVYPAALRRLEHLWRRRLDQRRGALT